MSASPSSPPTHGRTQAPRSMNFRMRREDHRAPFINVSIGSEVSGLRRAEVLSAREAQGNTAPSKAYSILRAVLLASVVVLSALLLGGSATKPLVDIYVLSLRYGDVLGSDGPEDDGKIVLKTLYEFLPGESSLKEVRIGYLGLCIKTNFDFWICDINPHYLLKTVQETSQVDSLNLIWLANRLRTEAISSICVFLALVSGLMGLTLSLVFSNSSGLTFRYFNQASRRARGMNGGTNRVFCLGFLLFLASYAAFNIAIWQQLASSVSTSMTRSLASDAISCRTGVAAIALGWVNFVLAVSNLVFLIIERGQHTKPTWEPITPRHATAWRSASSQVLDADSEAQECAEVDVEHQPADQPHPRNSKRPRSTWLRNMIILLGIRDSETTVRQRNTAIWVDQNARTRRRFAGTVLDED